MFMLMKSFCLFILLDLSLCIYNFFFVFSDRCLFWGIWSKTTTVISFYLWLLRLKCFQTGSLISVFMVKHRSLWVFFFLRTSPVYGFKQSLKLMRCSWLGKKTVCPIILGTHMGLIKVCILVLCFHKRHLHRNKF